MSEQLDELIYECVQRDDRDTLALLLKDNPAARTSNSSWIVAVAVLDNPEILPWLFSQGVAPDCRMGCDEGNDEHADTPLMLAIDQGELPIARLLLEHGADPNARDDLDETCFTRAIVCRNLDAMRLLAEYGADVSLADATHVLYAKYDNQTDVIDTLHELGFPIWEI